MRRLRLPALLLALAVAAFFLRSRPAAAPDLGAEPSLDPGLLHDRIWVDGEAARATDYTHALLVVTAAPLGVFQKASAYQSVTELFEYTQTDRKVDLRFPQSGKRRSFTYKVTRCADLPPFDLCLELSRNPWDGPRRYHGFEDPSAEARALPGLRHHLEHHLLGSR